MDESPWGTTSRCLLCLATAGRRGTEAEEAQREGRQPLPVLPKELGDASIFVSAGVMEAVLALLPVAGDGGPPLATDIADLQKAQQPSCQRCALGPPGLCPRPLARVQGSERCWVTCCRSTSWTAVPAYAGAPLELLALGLPGAAGNTGICFPWCRLSPFWHNSRPPLRGLHLPSGLLHHPSDILRADVVDFVVPCLPRGKPVGQILKNRTVQELIRGVTQRPLRLHGA